MEAREQKTQAAKQMTDVYTQHHQVHLVRHSNKPESSCPRHDSDLRLLSVETGAKERRGSEEKGVGGPGAREDSKQIKIFQTGEGFHGDGILHQNAKKKCLLFFLFFF